MQQNTIDIKALDMDGRGVGHLANEDGTQGKVIFVEGTPHAMDQASTPHVRVTQ